jgi:hypothetical protein
MKAAGKRASNLLWVLSGLSFSTVSLLTCAGC